MGVSATPPAVRGPKTFWDAEARRAIKSLKRWLALETLLGEVGPQVGTSQVTRVPARPIGMAANVPGVSRLGGEGYPVKNKETVKPQSRREARAGRITDDNISLDGARGFGIGFKSFKEAADTRRELMEMPLRWSGTVDIAVP